MGFYEDNSLLNIGRLTDIEIALAAREFVAAGSLIGSFVPETNIEEN